MHTNQTNIFKANKIFLLYLGSHKYEWHVALDPGHGGGGLVVPLDLDSDHARLVNNLLDESSVFTNDFTNKASWNLKYELDDGF